MCLKHEQLEPPDKRGQVGVLKEQNNVWVFRYTPEWVASPDGFDLSPALPREQDEIADGGRIARCSDSSTTCCRLGP
ncbi:hypothetical protein D3C78_1201870 [compost metagenome]